MTSIIKTSVLRAAVLSAFDLGRYTVTFGVNPSGDDLAVVPASIVLDLAERDDDLFGAFSDELARREGLKGYEAEMGHDDHGPAIPAQGVNAMADVAADLRGKPVYDPRPDPEPPVGPLTSTEGLKAGDVLRVIWASKYGGMLGASDGELAVVKSLNAVTVTVSMPSLEDGAETFDFDRFAYVGRPDADGWMDWPGGENPVGGAKVEIETAGKGNLTGDAGRMVWNVPWGSGWQIVRFRLVDTQPATSDT